MFDLNKMIYHLVFFLLLLVSLLGIGILLEKFFEKKESKIEVKTLKVKPIDVKTEILKEKKLKIITYIKEEPTIEIKNIKKNKSFEDVLVHLKPHSKLDIVAIKNQMVKPIIYTKSIKLSDLSIKHKKKTFINMLIPSILVAKHRIRIERKKVVKLLNVKSLSSKDSLWLMKKRHIFKASSIDELYDKMELHPTSIIIAQAIIESGWGTSRFFEKANNVFGIWSFNEHEKRISASEKRGKKTVYVKKYDDVEASIYDYFLLLSTKDVYQGFREKRLESQDPFVLIEELGKYSELGDEYIENLKNTIVKNKLLAYDSYSLDI